MNALHALAFDRTSLYGREEKEEEGGWRKNKYNFNLNRLYGDELNNSNDTLDYMLSLERLEFCGFFP